MSATSPTRVVWTDGEEHWTHKRVVEGGKEEQIRLFLWRKQPPAGTARAGVILWIHGSSMASQPTFDLHVPGRDDMSVMNWFVARGFDCWSLDNEGYGRSDKHRPIHCDLACGAADIGAAMDYVRKTSGAARVHLYGISSGALKAAMYAADHPEAVDRLALEAMVWTGENSPTLIDRRKRLHEWRGSTRRPMTRADIRRIFTRDREGLADEATIEAFTDAVLALDESIPNGTYVDMCANLPCVDPASLNVPTLILRGEYDGIASYPDVSAFFERVPNMDKQLTVLAGVGHGGLQSSRSDVVFHVLHGFFTQPSLR